MIQKLEKAIFYFFVFLLPFQARIALHQYGIASLAEYNSLFLYLTDIILAVLLVVFALSINFRKIMSVSWAERWRKIHEIEPLYWFLIAFWFLAVLASFPHRNIGLSFYQVIKTAEAILLFTYVTLRFKKYNFSAVLWIFIASVSVQALFGFMQVLDLSGFFSEDKAFFNSDIFLARARGMVPHPNLLAVLLSVGLFFSIYLIMKRRFFDDYPNPNFLPKNEQMALFKDAFAKILLLVLNFWLILSLFLTFSRTVVAVSLLIMALDLFFLWRQKWFVFYQKKFFIISGIILIQILLVGAVLLPELVARTKSVIPLLRENSHLVDPYALKIIKENILFGSGAGNYVFKLQQIAPTLTPQELQPVNNVYLLIISETGLISFVFFAAFLAYLLYGLVKAYVKEQDQTAKFWKSQLLFLFLFVAVISYFSNALWSFQQGQLLFWLILGIMVATATEVKKGPEIKPGKAELQL